jgi:hypothetical protein
MPFTRTATTAAPTVDETGRLPDALPALSAASPATRREAVRELSGDPTVVEHLAARLLVEPDASVRDVLLLALVRHDTAATVRALVPCLRSSDAAVRNETVRTLHAMPAGVRIVMPELLADADPDVRGFAVGMLQSLHHHDADAWIVRLVRDEGDPNVCAAAVDLLATSALPEARALLTALPARFPGEPFLAFIVSRALAQPASS